MIDLHTTATPNGCKVSIALEEPGPSTGLHGLEIPPRRQDGSTVATARNKLVR